MICCAAPALRLSLPRHQSGKSPEKRRREKMATWVKLAAGLSLFWAVGAQAADRTPEQVVKDHVASMKTGNVDAVMRDYAPNTVVITPPGLVPTQKPATG